MTGASPTPEGRLAALPDAAIGVAFLLCWFAPRLIGLGLIKIAMLTMVLEFLVIHSAAFMMDALFGDRPRLRKIMIVVGLGIGYSLFIVIICWALGEWWPMLAFWLLIANRLALVFSAPPELAQLRERKGAEWGSSTLLYLLWIVGTSIIPLPRFGLTPEVVAAAGLPGSGHWVDQPQSVLVAGAGYFLCQAWLQWHGRTLFTGKSTYWGEKKQAPPS